MERFLLSIFQKKYRNIEVALILDGSSNGSSEICQQLGELDLMMCLMRMANQDASTAYNDELSAAIGDYISLADSDD